MKKLFLFLVLPLVFAACSSDGVDSSLLSVSESGELVSLDDNSFDWGDISIDGGDVDQGFHFRNEGEEDLILKGVVTSCMCTSAYIELPDASISPIFGMHGNSDWTYAVKPGEEFEVEVVFDPMAHGPDAVGPIQRSVFLATSSIPNGDDVTFDARLADSVTEIKVRADVLYDKDYQEKYADADFVFVENEFDFGIVKQSAGIISKDFEFLYRGDEAIEVTAVPSSCACTSAKISKNKFEKGDSGVLTVSFDPNLHEEPEGKFFKTVTLLTDPELEKQPEVKIWAEMDLDLGPEAYKLKEHKD